MTRITPDLLLAAYAEGLFPMAEHRGDKELFWVDVERRGIFPLDRFHLPRRLARTVRQGRFEVAIDGDFAAVIRACASPAPGRASTWINHEIERLYTDLFRRGQAHCIECRSEGLLVGGLYGVALGGAFFGESMFSRATDASKVALVHLVARLRAGGFRLLDAQFLTSHLAQFGCIEIDRGPYRRLLAEAIAADASFHRAPRDWSPDQVLAALR